MSNQDLALFSLRSGADFASRVAAWLDVSLAAHEERDFEDGEHKIRPLENRLDRPVASAFMEKHRSAGKVRGSTVVAPGSRRRILILDDLIAGG